MEKLIQRVLGHCGYDGEPNEENLVQCFLDYTDSGIFGNLTFEEALEEINSGDISIKMMCYNLLKVR